MMKVLLAWFCLVCLLVLAMSLGPKEGQKQIHCKQKDDPTGHSRVKRGMIWLLLKNVRNTCRVSPAGEQGLTRLRRFSCTRKSRRHCFSPAVRHPQTLVSTTSYLKGTLVFRFFFLINSGISEFFITVLGLPYVLWVMEWAWPEPFPCKQWGSLIPVQMEACSLAQGGGSRVSRTFLKRVALCLVWTLSHFSYFSFLGESNPSRQFPSFNFKQ